MRARAYAADKKLNQALDDLNKAIEEKPDWVDAYIERGIVFTGARRFDDAIGDFNRAIELEPRNLQAYAMRASAKVQTDAKDDALYDVNQALQIASSDPLALRVRGNVYEALERPTRPSPTIAARLATDPFQTESREALQRLNQEVPPEEGRALGEAVAGWVIKEPQPGRYIASNPKYPNVRAELEMFGTGQPKILEWKLLRTRCRASAC